MTTTDSFFYIGKNHDICQDYCCHTNNSIALSDGCSSSPDTDFGSRIICKTFIKAMPEMIFDDFNMNHMLYLGIGNNNLPEPESIIQSLGLDKQALDATLLFATVKEDYFSVFTTGDGVIALIKDDDVEIIELIYPSGAPKYLNYYKDLSRYGQYIKTFGGEMVIKSWSFKDRTVKQTVTSRGYYLNNFDSNKYKAVLLMSDGVYSFSKMVKNPNEKYTVSVELFEVLKEMLDFKSFNGEFVKKRIKRFMKDSISLGWENYDDVSVAGISFER